MPYIGKSPEHGNFAELNDVSGSFNGSTTQFALTTRIGGIAITPVVESALLISLDGVIQEPTTDYTVSGTNITFTTAPASTVSFFGVVMGRQLDVGTPSDGTVTSAKLASTVMSGATDIGGAIADADLFLIDDGAGGTLRKTAASRLKTYIGGSDPASADGDTLGTASLEWSDLYLADGGVIYLGNDQDVTLTHVADTGVLLNSSRKIQFGDSASFIHQSADSVLTIDGEATIDLNASTAVLVSNDLKLDSDAAVLGFGADNDVTVTHVADTGLLLNGTMAIQFNDASQYINAPSNAILDINATDEIELNATLVDINANVEISGTATTTGVHTFTAVPVFPNNTVETADIQDNAVTLAKMAGGTDGNIISYDASGDPVAIATGNDGQVLTSTGAGSPPAFEDASGGAWALIGTTVATDDATVTVTGINATYDTYLITFTDIVPATNLAEFYVRFGTSGGILSAGGYPFHSYFNNTTGSAGSYSGSGNDGSTASNYATEIAITPESMSQGVGSASGYSLSGKMFLFMPHTHDGRPTWDWTFQASNSSGNRFYTGWGAGHRAVASEDLTQVQVLFSTGNVASGRLAVWGISHA